MRVDKHHTAWRLGKLRAMVAGLSWMAGARPKRRPQGFLWKQALGGLVLMLGWGISTPAHSAERVVVRVGPIRQSIPVNDLEYFAETGELPKDLKLYAPLLSPKTQQLLSTRLQIDPNLGDKLVEDLLHSSAGERFLNTLQVAIPDTDDEQIKTALSRAAQQPDGISLLGFLKAFPAQTVTIDVISAIALASQLNLPSWQSQTLSSVLDRELTVKGNPFQSKFDPSKPGPYWVWKQTMMLQDYKRDRSIPADLYWTRRQTEGPLVVISHGFGADRRFLSYLANHLASYGLTVVALEHPGSNVAWLTGDNLQPPGMNPGSILPASEFVDRPKDVSFLLDRLSQLNRFSKDLDGKFNTDKVVVIGHSLGGYTALALAGTPLSLDHLRKFCNDPKPVMFSPADLIQCNAADLPSAPTDLGDARVARVVLLNPVIGHLFDQKSLAGVNIPTLMLAATDDSITPAVSQQFLPFTQLHTSKYLLTAIGATHLSVGDPANLNRALTQSIFVRERHEDTESLRQLLQGVTLSFVQQLSPDAAQYRSFLSPAYAQSFSTNSLKLRLNSELPPNFANWLRMAALPMEQLVSSSLSRNRLAFHQISICRSESSCLFGSLPLVMFILSGNGPQTSYQLFNPKGRRSKRRRKQRSNHKKL
jgi:predicted dienelactone hydrolase